MKIEDLVGFKLEPDSIFKEHWKATWTHPSKDVVIEFYATDRITKARVRADRATAWLEFNSKTPDHEICRRVLTFLSEHGVL